MEEKGKRKFKGNNVFWIIFLVFVWYVTLSSYVGYGIAVVIDMVTGTSSAMKFVNENYTYTIGPVIVLVIICLVVRKNRFILRSFLPKGMGKDHRIQVVEDTYEPSQENTLRNLLLGLLVGFVTNFACILCALLHGDIKLYLDFSVGMIPAMIYAFVMVFIQSSSEELWCRGYMYERIRIHYPLWVAILVNGVFFGLLHSFNDSVSVLAIVNIAICGISYTLVRWYTGSIWFVMGIHTMWNYTQNMLFGLPNSGLVSEASIFHLDAANGCSSLIYDYGFGVEAAIPVILVDGILGVVCLLLARRNGRLEELKMSYEKLSGTL